MRSLPEYFLCFMIYSFIGWVCETVFCSYLEKHFVNRGFLNGPFCPIYGAGAMIAVFTLQRLPQSPMLIFFAGMLMMSIVEYFTGWVLEAIFKTTWWDYSDQKFNIKGRVCLVNSICFGIMIVALIFLIHPAVRSFVVWIPATTLTVITYILVFYFIIDFTITLWAILNLKARLEKLGALTDALRDKLDIYNWNDNVTSIKDRLDKLFDSAIIDTDSPLYKAVSAIRENITRIELENRPLQKRLLKAFPKLKSLKYPDHLNHLRERIVSLRDKL